ncbi:hypothetical protein EAH89_10570 [Roseomonas nepalensis]|uniref:Uncharacterized protein n=1 Tax=Muricoccus nepalensis TaxID=1854500 RepID=A0A502G5Q5_9PROT|nr:hypothetical protein EAH89_10570 [Roseomonas nepalensis]
MGDNFVSTLPEIWVRSQARDFSLYGISLRRSDHHRGKLSSAILIEGDLHSAPRLEDEFSRHGLTSGVHLSSSFAGGFLKSLEGVGRLPLCQLLSDTAQLRQDLGNGELGEFVDSDRHFA